MVARLGVSDSHTPMINGGRKAWPLCRVRETKATVTLESP
jgi:hypothetical protein